MTTPRSRSVTVVLFAVLLASASTAHAQTSGSQSQSERSGEQIYRAACVSCHGPDGQGQPQSVLGFEPPATFPDFTDCPVSSSEPDYIWLAIVHRGGRIRGESHIMPAFEDVLTRCRDRSGRPVPALALRRAAMAARQSELSAGVLHREGVSRERDGVHGQRGAEPSAGSVENRVDYEHRIGRRAQYEVGAPFVVQQGEGTQWSHGLGDINAALKYAFYDNLSHGSIAAAGGEVTLPTGKETEGLGGGVTIFEAFGMFDQALPRDSFVQFHAGFERPAEPRDRGQRRLLADRDRQDAQAEPLGPHLDADDRGSRQPRN